MFYTRETGSAAHRSLSSDRSRMLQQPDVSICFPAGAWIDRSTSTLQLSGSVYRQPPASIRRMSSPQVKADLCDLCFMSSCTGICRLLPMIIDTPLARLDREHRALSGKSISRIQAIKNFRSHSLLSVFPYTADSKAYRHG